MPTKQSSSRSVAYRNTRSDAFAFMSDFAHLPTRYDVLLSKGDTFGMAMKFRQRLYGWRRSAIVALIADDERERQEALTFLAQALGPRVTKEYLDYIKFSVIGDPRTLLFHVEASLMRPMYGPDIEFHDDPNRLARVADSRRLVEQYVFHTTQEPIATAPHTDHGFTPISKATSPLPDNLFQLLQIFATDKKIMLDSILPEAEAMHADGFDAGTILGNIYKKYG